MALRACTTGIPAQYGIPGIPAVLRTAAFPHLDIGGLANLGSNDYLPSDEISQTLQVTDDFTKILGKHSFKGGVEIQHVSSTPCSRQSSRGQFDWDGTFTDIPNLSTTTGGIAQLVFPPRRHRLR